MNRKLEIVRAIKQNDKFLIIAHDNLDGDSFGSGLALGLAIKNMGKDIKFLLNTSIPERYNFLPGIKELTTKKVNLKNYRVLFVLDTAGWDQIEKINPSLFRKFTVINIDHHVDNTRFGSINWIDTKASAVGELIYDLLLELKTPITKHIAECIYTAIQTDTGSFQFTNTTSTTHKIVSSLLQKGISPSNIAEQIYERMPVRRLLLLRQALSSLKTACRNQIIFLWITQKMFKDSKAKREDTEGFIDYLKSIEGIKVAIIFKEEVKGNEIRVTFRSKNPKIYVNKIAHKWNGGGHPAAAGCTIYGERKKVEKRVIIAVEKVLKNSQ